MREISTERIKIGEHVLIDGVEYEAKKEYLTNPCKGCAFENEHESCSDFMGCDGLIYVKVKKEPKYRPYEDTDEMIADWKERFKKNWSETSMPFIWVMGKNGDKHFLTDYSKRSVEFSYDKISMTALFNDYTYLDGSPCGKEVAE